MDNFSRDQEVAAVFNDPWSYPGLPDRPAASMRMSFSERHHLVWSVWTIFEDGQQFHARRIEWPCAMGAQSQTSCFTRTFAAETSVDQRLAESIIAEAITAAHTSPPLASEAVAIDGAERSLCYWQEGVRKTANWATSVVGSSLDLWFRRAVALLDAHLPESHAHAFYKIRRDEIPSTEAANPRIAS